MSNIIKLPLPQHEQDLLEAKLALCDARYDRARLVLAQLKRATANDNKKGPGPGRWWED